MHHTLYPRGVCSTRIDLDIEGGIIHNLTYTDGCDGNLQALGRLCEGMEVNEVIRRLDGIRCGITETSCGDQLAKLLKEIV